MIVGLIITVLLIAYFCAIMVFMSKKDKQEKAVGAILKKKFRLFFYEKKIAQIFGVKEKDYKKIFVPLRVVIVALLAVMALSWGAIALVFLAMALIILYMDNKTKALVDEIGVEYIPLLNQFLDVFSPALASGSSADQAMLKYISDVNDDNLLQWWVHKDDGQFSLDVKWKSIVEVYNMMEFNEKHGVGNGLKVIEEMQKTLTQKERFYNEFVARMGEIKPIMYSYYICVPILLLMSVNQTHDFWFGPWGIVCAIALIIIFFIANWLLYTLKKNTIKVMF